VPRTDPPNMEVLANPAIFFIYVPYGAVGMKGVEGMRACDDCAPGVRKQVRPYLLVATLLLAASSPAGAWLPVLPRGASRAGCGMGHAKMRAWWRRSTHRAAGALKAANEEPPVTQSNRRMLDALPLPLLPSPFNATLVGLLGGTPSRWLAGGKKDWSVTGSGTDPPSSATRTYSSPQIPTPAGGRSAAFQRHLCAARAQGWDCTHCCFSLLVSPSVSPDVP
jgi:hypothetical protein